MLFVTKSERSLGLRVKKEGRFVPCQFVPVMTMLKLKLVMLAVFDDAVRIRIAGTDAPTPRT